MEGLLELASEYIEHYNLRHRIEDIYAARNCLNKLIRINSCEPIMYNVAFHLCDILGRIALYIPKEALFSVASFDNKDIIEELESIIEEIGYYYNAVYTDNNVLDSCLYSIDDGKPIHLNLLTDKLKCLRPLDPGQISNLQYDENLRKLKFGDISVDGIALTRVPFYGIYELPDDAIRDIGKMTIKDFLKTGGQI